MGVDKNHFVQRGSPSPSSSPTSGRGVLNRYFSERVETKSQTLKCENVVFIAVKFNLGFPARELRKLEALTLEHQEELLEAWNDYFGT